MIVPGGWPVGTLIELLTQQPGIGELRLLAPILAKVSKSGIVMLEPPHAPQITAFAGLGIAPAHLTWIRSGRGTADALWAAEQVLRSGCYGAVCFWQKQMRPESLRRLNLAAQQGETLFFTFRPLAAAQDASPAPLRLALRPASGGVDIEIVKRRGPARDEHIFLPLSVPGVAPSLPSQRKPVDRPLPVEATTTERVEVTATERAADVVW